MQLAAGWNRGNDFKSLDISFDIKYSLREGAQLIAGLSDCLGLWSKLFAPGWGRWSQLMLDNFFSRFISIIFFFL